VIRAGNTFLIAVYNIIFVNYFLIGVYYKLYVIHSKN